MKYLKIVYHLLSPKERIEYILFSLFVVMVSGFESLGIYLFYYLLTLFTEPSQYNAHKVTQVLTYVFGEIPYRHFLILVLVTIGVIFLAKNLFSILQIYAQQTLLSQKSKQLQTEMARLYLDQTFAFHLNRGYNHFIHRLNQTDFALQSVLGSYILIFTDLITILAMLAMLLRVDFYSTLYITVLSTLSLSIFYRIFRSRVARYGQGHYKINERIQKNLAETFMGIKELKILHCEGFFISLFEQHKGISTILYRKNQVVSGLPKNFIELIFIGMFISLIGFMLYTNRMSSILPLMGVYALTSFRVLPSLNRVVSLLNVVKFQSPQLEMIDTDRRELRFLPPLPLSKSPFQFTQGITVKNLTFTFEGRAIPALDRVSLFLPFGKTIGFIGRSGSGKTTLMDTMLGLLEPTSGEVLVDGISIYTHLPAWHANMGYIPQLIFLLDASIRANVAFGVPSEEIDATKVARALEQAQLSDWVQSLPEGLETTIGDRGIRLSGGQRQRIGIARALYRDPSVLFLDEATSALDNETERSVMQAVHAMHGTKTIIIIAHRLSTIAQCDVVYLMEKGKIKHIATYPDMMAYLERTQQKMEEKTSETNQP